MGIFGESKRDRDNEPMTADELMTRSRVDGIFYRDLQVVAQMMQMGADLKAPRELVFYLYFTAEAAARAAASDVVNLGLAVEVNPPAEHNNRWCVKATSEGRAIIPDFLRDTIDACTEISEQHGGEYDGWEAGITPAEAAALKKG
jgi:Regulator of ribonuclease activity B